MQGLKLAAIVLTALALVPGGAHLLALPNKIGLSQEAYFTVQGIYRGWALLGTVLLAALATDTVLAIRLRSQPGPFRLAVAGAVSLAVTLAVFFTWTYPANQAISNWTVVPPNWAALRTQWEYSHAVKAGITLVALCAVTLAALRARD